MLLTGVFLYTKGYAVTRLAVPGERTDAEEWLHRKKARSQGIIEKYDNIPAESVKETIAAYDNLRPSWYE
jgi:hypothetical protein